MTTSPPVSRADRAAAAVADALIVALAPFAGWALFCAWRFTVFAVLGLAGSASDPDLFWPDLRNLAGAALYTVIGCVVEAVRFFAAGWTSLAALVTAWAICGGLYWCATTGRGVATVGTRHVSRKAAPRSARDEGAAQPFVRSRRSRSASRLASRSAMASRLS